AVPPCQGQDRVVPRSCGKPTRRALHCANARSDGESGVHWVLAAIGALLGAALGEAEAIVLGLVAGALLGWQGARIAQLRQRLAALEGRGHVAPPAETAIPASPPPTAAAVRTATAPAPGATPAAAAARPVDAG